MKNSILRNICLIVLVLSAFVSYSYAQYGSQTELVDSLKSKLETSKGVEAIDLLNQIAYYTTLSLPEEARNLAEKALANANLLNYPKGQADAAQRLGILKYRQGLTSQSIDNLNYADSLYHILEDSASLCVNYRCLGNAYIGYQDYPTILYYYRKALDCCDSVADPIIFATNLHSIGSALRKTNSSDESENFLLRAREIYISQNYEFGIAGIHSSLADIDIETGKPNEALKGYFNALHHYEKIQDKASIGLTKTRIAKAYLLLYESSKARKYANEGLKVSREAYSKPRSMEALRLLYLISRQEGKTEEALKYHERFYQISEEITDARHQKIINLLDSERLRAESVAENIILKKDQELLGAKMDKQQSLTIWSIIVIILATIFIIFLTVINRQRKNAMALTEARRQELADSNMTKNTLLDILSHDLKNPAGSIRGLSEVLLEESPDNKYLTAIQKSAEKLIQVIDQTATFAELQQGNPIAKEDLKLKELITRVLEESKEEISNYQMRIVVNIPDKMTIYANPIIESIFRNFIQNAVKYAHSGKSISVDTTQLDQGLKISVSDMGTSIPKKQREQIFRRSIQLAPLDNRGSGLGLAISKRIAEAHHAEIGVDTKQPKGNSFFIILPQKARYIS